MVTGDAEQRARPRQPRAVVAARRRDDAARALVWSSSAVIADTALRTLNELVGLVVLVLDEHADAVADRRVERRVVAQRRRRKVRPMRSAARRTSSMVIGQLIC